MTARCFARSRVFGHPFLNSPSSDLALLFLFLWRSLATLLGLAVASEFSMPFIELLFSHRPYPYTWAAGHLFLVDCGGVVAPTFVQSSLG